MNLEVEVPRTVRALFGNDVAGDMLKRIGRGERVGQAFMNALPDNGMFASLTDSLADPFFKDTYASVWRALDYLTKAHDQ